MNIVAISETLKGFVERYKTTFSTISQKQSAQLELAAVIGVQEHFRAAGWKVQVINPGKRKRFVVKMSTNGRPWNFSRMLVTAPSRPPLEIHMNLKTRGAGHEGVYCTDVAIVNANAVPMKDDPIWVALENEDLVSFFEVKRLVVYPMLLAQFIGIVHELLPRFLQAPIDYDFGRDKVPPPTLISLGSFSGNSKQIVDGYAGRGIHVNIVENFDMRLAWARSDPTRSPLYWDSDPVIS